MSSRKKTWLLLIAIMVLAAFFRIYDTKNLPPGLYPDEAMNGNNALESITTGEYKVFYPENNGREGLFINVQALFLKFLIPTRGTPEPWMLRLPSVIFGILTVLGVYFLAKELFGYEIRKGYEGTKNSPENNSYIRNKFAFRSEYIALLSAFFMATSFWHVNFSRIGFRAIMAPFFLTWALYFLLKSFRVLSARRFTLYAVLGGISFGLGFYSYIAYRATPLLVFLIAIIYWWKNKEWSIRRKFLLSTFYFLLFTIIVAAPLGIYFLENPADFFGRTGQISIFESATPLKDLGLNILKTAGQFNFYGDGNWRHNIAGAPELSWPMGIFFLVGAVLALVALVRKTKPDDEDFKRFGMLFLWLIIAALPVVVSNEGIPHALRSILMIPAVMILAGFGAYSFFNLISASISPTISRFFVFVVVVVIVIVSYNDYFIRWAKNPEVAGAFNANYIQLGREINALPKDVPKYVIVETGGVSVRNIPMPAQTVMFITDSFREKSRREKNIVYLTEPNINAVPADAKVFKIK